MHNNKLKGISLVLLASVLWGTTGSTQGFSPENASPYAIGALRMMLGGTLLLLFAIFNGAFKNKFSISKRDVLMASLCMAAYQPLFFTGVSRTGIALGTVLTIGSAPIFTGIIERLRGSKLESKWIVATSLAVVGCVLLFSGQDTVVMDVLGTLCSLGAGLSYAIYVQVSKSLFEKSPSNAANGLIFFIAGLILLPVLMTQDLSWVPTGRGILVAIQLGLFATAIPYTLFARGLTHISSPTAVTLTLGEPLTAALLGIFVFKEELSLISYVGLFILFFGLLLTSLPTKGKDFALEES